MSLSGARSSSSRPADFPFADILYVNLEWGADHAETIGGLAEDSTPDDYLDMTRSLGRGLLGAVIPRLRPAAPRTIDTPPGRH